MSLMDTITSPPVLIGGAVIGAVILLMGSAGNGGGSPVASPDAALAFNIAAMGHVTQQADISADLEKARFQADVSKQANVLGFMRALNSDRTVLASKRMEVEGGITSGMFAAQSAIIIDQQQNTNRLSLAWVAADTERLRINAAVTLAQIQAKTTRNANWLNFNTQNHAISADVTKSMWGGMGSRIGG